MSDEEINELIARSEEEEQIFRDIDIQRDRYPACGSSSEYDQYGENTVRRRCLVRMSLLQCCRQLANDIP